MTTETASLIIKVDSRGAASASRDLDTLTGASGKAERATGALTGAWKVLTTVAASAALAKAVTTYVRLADASANMSVRLRLATSSQEEFNTAHRETFQIAQRTSSELGSVVDLYAKLAQSTGELGLSQGQVLQMTETITQAFTVSGASAQEAAGGLRQLGQAMAGGTLRAEEFNSIIESSPRIVQALADHFGVSFGKVRALVNDGKISSEQFAQAMLAASEKVQAEFDQMPLTVGRATQQVRNALVRLVGDVDDTEGASRDLAIAIADVARALESDEMRSGLASMISGLVDIATFAANAAAALVKVGGDAREALAAAEKFQRDLFGKRMGADPDAGLFGVGDYLREKAPWLYAPIGGSDEAPEKPAPYHPGIDSSLPAPLPGDPSGKNNAVSADLQKEIDKIREQAAAYGLSRVALANLNKEKALAAATNDVERDAIRGAYGELVKRIQAEEGATRGREAAKKADDEKKRATDALAAAAQSYNARLAESIALHGQQGEAARVNYEIQHGALQGLSADQAAVLREAAQWQDFLDDVAALETVWADARQDATDRMIDGWSSATDEMSEFAKQAARNMQDAFADSLFDPFENGVSGMLQRFADALRRMAAEAAASQLFDALGTWGAQNSGAGGWMGMVAGIAKGFSGQKAAGGPVQAGSSVITGDGGEPEIFVPGQSGRVYPVGKTSGTGGIQVVINNNAGARVQAREERQPSANGGPDIRKLIIDVVAGDMAGGGALASATRGRFGLREAV